MPESEYTWAENRSFRVPAQLVGEVIEQIIERDGVCEAAALVAEASDPSSPIHGVFDDRIWDDEYAAERYREEQARKVISSIRVVVEGAKIPPPAFVSVKVDTSAGTIQGYQETLKVIMDPGGMDQVLAEALADLTALERRYDSLIDLAPVWNAVKSVKKRKAA